ncbi:MAG: VCBS repeat-containing protein, partial [bacterium]
MQNVVAQTSFSDEIIITGQTYAANSIFSADLDGDGDHDLLSASSGDDKIAWYENIDGLGTFGPQQVITTSAGDAQSVYSADLDGDGDHDVLSASMYDDKIAWYENLDGQGTFGPQQVITTSANGAKSVFSADLDGDGDNDVLSASSGDDKIAWYENTDGLGTFGPQLIIMSATDAVAVFSVDLDGDGDNDVLSASDWDDRIAWYENIDGQGRFGTQQIITTNTNGARSVFSTDLDGDGDNDVLSASSIDNKIAWFKNLDGQGT